MRKLENNVDKMYTYLKGFFTGAGYIESLMALQYARDKHTGQTRRDGITPYIIHPLQMACYAVALGIRDDYTLSIILLHDVCEDCNVKVEELPFSREVQDGVQYMTLVYADGEEKIVAKRRYFRNLLKNKRALVVKAIDKYMNLKTMVGCFTEAQIIKNVKEADEFLNILSEGKKIYPDLSDIIYVLRDNIRSVNEILASDYHVYAETCKAGVMEQRG